MRGTLDDALDLPGKPGTLKFAEAAAALADEKVVLPLREFARLVVKKAQLAEQAALAVRRWGARQRPAFSLEKSAVDHRCRLSAVRGLNTSKLVLRFAKTAADGHNTSKLALRFARTAADAGDAEGLARDYACYRVAALRRTAAFDDDFTLTARLAASLAGFRAGLGRQLRRPGGCVLCAAARS